MPAYHPSRPHLSASYACAAAVQTLDGSPIPEHLVPQHPGKITMKVSSSAHSDLSIRSQSDRSR
jgi:hypothetical protein